jgi:enoyl-CoA hydratase/carnithine racemase
VIPAADLMTEARKLAAKWAGYSALSLRAAKKAIDEGMEKPRIEDGLQVELSSFAHLFGSEDQKEGMAAFLEKRPPQFKDR